MMSSMSDGATPSSAKVEGEVGYAGACGGAVDMFFNRPSGAEP